MNKPLISLLGLTSAYSTFQSSNTYITKGIFQISDGDINTGGILGDGSPTVALSDNGLKLIRMSKISEDGDIAVGQVLKSDSIDSTNFGQKVDLYGNSKFGNYMLVADSDLTYFYSGGDWNTWSVQQVLKPPTSTSTSGTYGSNIRIDRTDYKESIVSCDFCGTSTFPPNLPIGQLFVYEADPHYSVWTQSALLQAEQTSSPAVCNPAGPFTGYSVFLGQTDARISGNNIIATTAYTHCSVGGAILFSKRAGQWSQQQTFWNHNTEYSSLNIERDTIIIGSTAAKYGSAADVGAVFIQYPNTPEYGVKPEPGVPTQWSLHQILYPPAHAAGSLFGSDITIQGNNLYIGAAPLNTIFYYSRPTLTGSWSLQQSLTNSDIDSLSSHQVFGSKVLGFGSIPGKAVATIFENNYQWDCLIISLEDTFGDGWDTARLQITSPVDEPAYFSPFCTSSNPFEFRYCPRSGTSNYEGMYRLSIVDGPKSKFFWEIQWRVYEEKTGTWYKGNHATRMDFHFDSNNLELTRRGIVHDLPLNISCVTCPGKPQEKQAKPKPRTLKDSTHAPTISPAPTLGQTTTYGDSWRYLTLSTSGESWFDIQDRGTNYYISDTQGHRLLATGTSCSTLSAQCYQTIPDGQYVLRVGGGLNIYHDAHKWSFCGRVGGAEEQLNFVVKDGECDAIATYTRSTYCSSVLHATILLSVQLEMFGILESTETGQLSEADLMALSDSISSIVGHGLTSNDVKLNSITNQYGHAIFNVNVGVDAANFGGDPHDLDSMETVISQVSSIFNNAATSGRLNTALKSTTIQGAQFFQQLDSVQVIETSLVSIHPHADVPLNSMVTDVLQQPVVVEAEPTEYPQSFYLMVAGYLASVIAVIALAVYAYTQVKTASPTPKESNKIDVSLNNKNNNNDSPSVSAVVNPIVTTTVSPAENTVVDATTTTTTITTTVPTPVPASKVTTSRSSSSKKQSKVQQPLRVVDSTKKSQRMNTIMIADLIQMVKEEDEQLQKTMSSDHFKV